MRREVSLHGEEILKAEKMTFQELAEVYKKARLVPAVFENGVKISGRKSNADWLLIAPVDYFGSKLRWSSLNPFGN